MFITQIIQRKVKKIGDIHSFIRLFTEKWENRVCSLIYQIIQRKVTHRVYSPVFPSGNSGKVGRNSEPYLLLQTLLGKQYTGMPLVGESLWQLFPGWSIETWAMYINGITMGNRFCRKREVSGIYTSIVLMICWCM